MVSCITKKELYEKIPKITPIAWVYLFFVQRIDRWTDHIRLILLQDCGRANRFFDERPPPPNR